LRFQVEKEAAQKFVELSQCLKSCIQVLLFFVPKDACYKLFGASGTADCT